MSKRDGKQQGPQNHAEGAHGEKTHQRLLEQLHSRTNGVDKADSIPIDVKNPSAHRIGSERQQHDEAEKKRG